MSVVEIFGGVSPKLLEEMATIMTSKKIKIGTWCIELIRVEFFQLVD